MSRRYKDNPIEHHKEGTDTEYECLHLFQEFGGFCGYNIQDGKPFPALISFDGYNTISPDLMVMRSGRNFFIESKSKEATRLYQTFGFPTKTLDHYRHLERKTQIQVLLCIRDKTLSPLGTKDPNAFLVAALTQDGLLDDAVELNGQTYIPKREFTSLVEFLTIDREMAELEDDEDEDLH